MSLNIESLAQWSEAAPFGNKNQVVREAIKVGPQFWDAWRSNKSALKAAGIVVRPDNGRWAVSVVQDAGEVAALPVSPSGISLEHSHAAVDAALARGVNPPADRNWSDEQKAVFAFFRTGDGNLVIRARAGTGKTTTIVVALALAPERRKLYAVFNKKNQREAEGKISDPNVDVLTLHSLGFRFIRSVWSGVKPDDEVEKFRISRAAGRNAPLEVITQVAKLIGFAKNLFVNPSLADLSDLADRKNIEVSSELADSGWSVERLVQIAMDALELAKERDEQGRISFNDMVWLPVAMGWVRPCYDLVVVDEAQDMNLPQLLMASGSCVKSGRMVVVGDDRQAIYGFRGAAQDGIDMMKERLNASELGLTITYRCPKKVVALAQALVPDYQAADEAPDGEVSSIGDNLLVDAAQPGDTILSRANAPLMPVCLALLRKGVAAKVEGREIGKMLAGLARKMKAKSVPHFIERVTHWGAKEINRFAGSKYAEEKAGVVQDQMGCLIAIAEGCASVDEIFVRMESLFQDSDGFQKPCVLLSSVHKAKGLEWNKVFLIAKTFKRAEQGGEEANIYYVAITRAKKHLVHVHESHNRPEEN